MSTSGGVDKAFSRAESLGLEVMQIFTRNQNQWNSKPLPSQVVASYLQERDRTGINTVFAHGSYLINLCSPDKSNLDKSRSALADELQRCDLLEIPYLILHPGSHLGQGEAKGLAAIAESINQVFQDLPNTKTMLLLENTAGQGSNLGYRFEQLAEIRNQIEFQDRTGICFDTCHAFAAGYPMSSESQCRHLFEEMDSTVGLEHLKVFHFNDSKKPLGSRVDRHEHIGKGEIGLTLFRYLMRSKKFSRHPMALETPKSADYHEDLENIQVLKGLLKD
jgi:deoxyribonuclease IV